MLMFDKVEEVQDPLPEHIHSIGSRYLSSTTIVVSST